MEIDNNIDDTMVLFEKRFNEIMTKLANILDVLAIEHYDEPLSLQIAINDALKDVGYFDLVDDIINDEYDKNYDNILALFTEGGFSITYTTQDIEIIKILKRLDFDKLLNLGTDLAMRLQRDFYKYTISDMSKETIIANLKKSLSDSNLLRYAKTYVETSISEFNQNLIDLKTADIPDSAVYIYRGVHDKKTREFCKCLINKKAYYTKVQSRVIKNDKRRQWNCRHLIVPISLDYAKTNGYVKGELSC